MCISFLQFLEKLIGPSALGTTRDEAFRSGKYSLLYYNIYTTQIHYRALRTSAKDYHFKYPKEALNKLFGRAIPLQWMQYTSAKIAITLYNLCTGPQRVLLHKQ